MLQNTPCNLPPVNHRLAAAGHPTCWASKPLPLCPDHVTWQFSDRAAKPCILARRDIHDTISLDVHISPHLSSEGVSRWLTPSAYVVQLSGLSMSNRIRLSTFRFTLLYTCHDAGLLPSRTRDPCAPAAQHASSPLPMLWRVGAMPTAGCPGKHPQPAHWTERQSRAEETSMRAGRMLRPGLAVARGSTKPADRVRVCDIYHMGYTNKGGEAASAMHLCLPPARIPPGMQRQTRSNPRPGMRWCLIFFCFKMA